MTPPLRCFSCNKVVGNAWGEYQARVHRNSEDPCVVMDDLGLERFCCRRMIMSHVDAEHRVDVIGHEGRLRTTEALANGRA